MRSDNYLLSISEKDDDISDVLVVKRSSNKIFVKICNTPIDYYIATYLLDPKKKTFLRAKSCLKTIMQAYILIKHALSLICCDSNREVHLMTFTLLFRHFHFASVSFATFPFHVLVLQQL